MTGGFSALMVSAVVFFGVIYGTVPILLYGMACQMRKSERDESRRSKVLLCSLVLPPLLAGVAGAVGLLLFLAGVRA